MRTQLRNLNVRVVVTESEIENKSLVVKDQRVYIHLTAGKILIKPLPFYCRKSIEALLNFENLCSNPLSNMQNSNTDPILTTAMNEISVTKPTAYQI